MDLAPTRLHHSVVIMFLLAIAVCMSSSCATRLDFDYSAADEQALLNRVLPNNQQLNSDAPVLVLSEGLRNQIDERIVAKWSSRQKIRELRKFFFHEDELNIQYNADYTKTAMETFETKSGNCLAMTNLFIAAARHAGIDAHFQTVSVKPTWDYQQNTMIRYEHVVATGRASHGEEYVVDFLPDMSLADRTSETISDQRALALYYNNRGAEYLVDGKSEEAIHNLQRALYLNGEFSDAWNNLGAAYRRAGEFELAEFSYRKAVSLNTYNLSALSNLARFYEYNNQPEKAQPFVERVRKYESTNPYYLFSV